MGMNEVVDTVMMMFVVRIQTSSLCNCVIHRCHKEKCSEERVSPFLISVLKEQTIRKPKMQ